MLSRSLLKVKLDRTHGPACLHLAEVVMLLGPPVFIAREPWALAGPFLVRLANLWKEW